MSDRRDLPDDDAGEEMDLGEDQEAEIDDAEDGQDAADDDQDGEDAPGDDEEERQARDVERRPESRYQRNRREAQEARREAAELRRRLDDLERRGSDQRPQGPDPQAAAQEERQFLESLELMSPAQAALAVEQRATRRMAGAMQQMQVQMLDRQDKRDFDRLCETDRAAARLAPKVEQMIAEARRNGNFSLDRETAFTFAFGQEVRARARTEAPRQRAAGQRRIARQTVRPGSGRGDAPRQNSRRNQDGDDEALLRGITVVDL